MLESPNTFSGKVSHYATILNPLFWHDDFNRSDRIFEWVCTMIRVTSMKANGWDSYVESMSLLEDLTRLMQLDLLAAGFRHPKETQARLAVLSYSHMIEMNGAYDLLANLLRLRLSQKYSIQPLEHLNGARTAKVNGKKVRRLHLASPSAKINEINRLAQMAGVPEVGVALAGIYDNKIRNAVFHSDYAISDNKFVLLSDFYLSTKQGAHTQVIPFDELGELTGKAFAFHSALIILWKRQRKLFQDFRGKIVPLDFHYKGVVEFTFEDDMLNGFRVYWPNGTVSMCKRDADDKSYAENIHFEQDGSIGFFVGVLATNPGAFSPCVEQGCDPNYAVVPGTDKRPHWPSDLRPYAL